MRLVIDEIRQRLRAQRPGEEIGHPAAGIADAARPAARIARAPLRKAPARIARARGEWIRSKCLRYLDSELGKQVRTGGRRRIRRDFRHSGGSGASKPSTWV